MLALADDATGALETGARMAAAVGPLPVWLASEPPAPARFAKPGCLVIDTETRHLAPELAASRIRQAALPGVAAVYKKTDSTLRGNIAAEFRALMEVWPGRPLVYVPAYPELGRTVVNGELLVNGRPLRETPFARDPLDPASEGLIPALLGNCGVPVSVVRRPAELGAAIDKGGILVCDGSQNADLEAIAEALRAAPSTVLAAGPAAFSGYWARALSPAMPGMPSEPRISHCLVVNGSRHPASREQVRWAQQQGWRVVVWRGPQTGLAGAEPWTVITTPDESLDKPAVVARELARAVSQAHFDTLVVFGGDTVYALCAALGIEMVTACRELTPGVPLSCTDRLTLITKAGGFGAQDVLGTIRAALGRRL